MNPIVPINRKDRFAWMQTLVRANLAFQVLTIRLTRGWTIEQLANKSNLPVGSIQRIEDMTGDPPATQTLIQLAQAFDCALFFRFSGWDDYVDEMGNLVPPAQPDGS